MKDLLPFVHPLLSQVWARVTDIKKKKCAAKSARNEQLPEGNQLASVEVLRTSKMKPNNRSVATVMLFVATKLFDGLLQHGRMKYSNPSACIRQFVQESLTQQ